MLGLGDDDETEAYVRLVARANPRVFSVRRVKANSMVMVVSTTLTSSSDKLQ